MPKIKLACAKFYIKKEVSPRHWLLPRCGEESYWGIKNSFITEGKFEQLLLPLAEVSLKRRYLLSFDTPIFSSG